MIWGVESHGFVDTAMNFPSEMSWEIGFIYFFSNFNLVSLQTQDLMALSFGWHVWDFLGNSLGRWWFLDFVVVVQLELALQGRGGLNWKSSLIILLLHHPISWEFLKKTRWYVNYVVNSLWTVWLSNWMCL